MCYQLFGLSYPLFGEIITKWLLLSDVSRLDRACAAAATRTQYLFAVASSTATVPDPKIKVASRFAEFLQWVSKRRLLIQDLIVPSLLADVLYGGGSDLVPGSSLSRLRILNMEQCHDLADQTFTPLVQSCLLLRDVSIGSKGVPSWLTDSSLAALSRCSRLHSLKAENNSFITHTGLNAMSQGCRGLRKLQLLNCARIGDAALQAVATNCPRLQELCLRDNFLVTTAGLENLLRKCLEMKVLNLVRCKAALPGAEEAPLDLHCLRYSGTEMCPRPGVAQFAGRCRNLVALELRNVRELTTVHIDAMRLSVPSLRTLRLDAGHSPASSDLNKLLSHCTALTDLEIHSPQVTAAVLQSAVEACRGLASLDVSWCDNLTDAALQALTPGGRALRHLSVKGARHVTERGVRSVITHCRALESVNVQFCPGVRAALLQEDVVAHPGLLLMV
jgi:hypothetical protein